MEQMLAPAFRHGTPTSRITARPASSAKVRDSLRRPSVCLCGAVALARACCVRRRNRSLPYFEGFPDALDYGLYFFGPEGACAKHVAGQPNTYFKDGQDTLIYVHGWEVREGFCHRSATCEGGSGAAKLS